MVTTPDPSQPEDEEAAQSATESSADLKAPETPEDSGPSADKRPPAKLPPEVAEVVDQLPDPVKRSVELSMFSMMHGGPRMGHPIIEKFTPEHISKFLDHSREESLEENRIRASNRWFALVFSALGIGFFVFLIWFLADSHSEILLDILKVATGFLGGLGGGYGIKAYLDSRRGD